MAERAPSPDRNGLPLCSQEECPQYDGKRCRELGFRPHHFCEPQLIEDRENASAVRAVLLRVQKHRYHEPNSDFLEHCEGCGRNPYNVPQHDADCLVPAIAKVLRDSDPEARS
jgi:hypothetical protein